MLRICLIDLARAIHLFTRHKKEGENSVCFAFLNTFCLVYNRLSLKPVVMMAWMMRMCVSYSMRMTLMHVAAIVAGLRIYCR